jgi:hypothetical protein
MTENSTGEVVDVMSKAQWDALLKGKVMMMIMMMLALASPYRTNCTGCLSLTAQRPTKVPSP